MKEETRVFEIRKEVTRTDIETERLIFELREHKNVDDEEVEPSEWIYKAPNAQEHTQEQVEQVLKKLKELNNNL